MNAVEFKNVDIVFGDERKRALELLDAGGTRESILEETGAVIGVADATLPIKEGEVCVLMGLSGSGKSTLLRAVNGLNEVARGEVLVRHKGDMVDVANCDAQTLRALRTERVAMVFQQFALLPWRTVEQNVGFGLEIRGMGEDERRPIVDEKLKLVGLDQWRHKYAHELSGGMQQRVGLARAFATDADILLMDEPFSALDPLIRTHLQDELLELQRALRKTIIFVSHNLDEALKLGTHIAIMEAGRIVQYGDPEGIVLDPANAYVADFVAHMNPLNVLRGASLMTPVDEITRDGEALLLDWSGHSRLTLDDQGRPETVTVEGKAGRILEYDAQADLKAIGEAGDTVLAASADIPMRLAIQIRHDTCNPVLFVDDGRLIGVIGDEEIYRGILRQTDLGNNTN